MADHAPIYTGVSSSTHPSLAPPIATVNGGQGGRDPSAIAVVLASSPAPPSSTAPQTPTSAAAPRGENGFPGHIDAEAGPSRPLASANAASLDVKDEKAFAELAAAATKRKRKWSLMGYGEDEQAEMEKRHTALSLSLALDQASTLYPDPPTAFTNYEDVINRLLPYHVWQIHDSELERRTRTAEEVAKNDAQVSEATSLLRRVEGIQNRLWKIRRREGTQPSSIPPYIHLLRLSQAEQRDSISDLNAKIRNRQDERGRIEGSNRRLQTIIAERRRAMGLTASPATGSPMPNSPARPLPSQTPGARPQPPAGTPTARSPATPLFPTSAQMPPSARPQMPPSTPASFINSPTPSTNSPTARGRPRGRPRGTGRSGLRESVITHTPAPKGSQTASTASPSTAPPIATSATATAAPATPPKQTGGAPGKRPPIRMSLPKKALKELVISEIIESDSRKPPGPGVLHGVKDDKLDVTLDIAAFTVPQLHVMGRILNVDPGTLEVKGTPTRRSGANARAAGETAIVNAAAKQ